MTKFIIVRLQGGKHRDWMAPRHVLRRAVMSAGPLDVFYAGCRCEHRRCLAPDFVLLERDRMQDRP